MLVVNPLIWKLVLLISAWQPVYMRVSVCVYVCVCMCECARVCLYACV